MLIFLKQKLDSQKISLLPAKSQTIGLLGLRLFKDFLLKLIEVLEGFTRSQANNK